jgi:uncharacterized protein YyaL (SSP411 family)
MTAAYATAYRVLGDEDYLVSAERAAAFIRDYLTRPDGHLYVRYRDGDVAGTGYLDDYAYTAWAYLSLYEAIFDAAYLQSASETAEMMCALLRIAKRRLLSVRRGRRAPDAPPEDVRRALPSATASAAPSPLSSSGADGGACLGGAAARQLGFLGKSIKEYPTGHSFGLMPP